MSGQNRDKESMRNLAALLKSSREENGQYVLVRDHVRVFARRCFMMNMCSLGICCFFIHLAKAAAKAQILPSFLPWFD